MTEEKRIIEYSRSTNIEKASEDTFSCIDITDEETRKDEYPQIAVGLDILEKLE